MALVGSYVGWSRQLILVFPVFVLAGLRFAIGGLCLLPWLRARPEEPALRRVDQQQLFAAGLIGNFCFSLCMLQGVAWSSAVAAGIVMAALPGMVAVLSWAWLKEPVARRTWLAVACAAAGTVLVSINEAPTGPGGSRAWQGNGLLMLAVLCEATYMVLARQLTQRLSARRITAWVNLWGLLLVTPWALWQAREVDFSAIRGTDWAGLVFYALAASVVSVWLWMLGVRQVPAARAGVYTVCLPVASTLVGVIWLGETMSTVKTAALTLAALGILLATRP